MRCEATLRKHDLILRTLRGLEKTGEAQLSSTIANACGMSTRVLIHYIEQMEADGKVEVGKGGGKRFWRTPGGAKYPEGVYPGTVGESMLHPISVGEIEETKDRTNIGDEFCIRIQGDGNSTMIPRMEKTRVKTKTRHLCIMQNGRTFSWGQLAMYYRTPGKILVMEV